MLKKLEKQKRCAVNGCEYILELKKKKLIFYTRVETVKRTVLEDFRISCHLESVVPVSRSRKDRFRGERDTAESCT